MKQSKTEQKRLGVIDDIRALFKERHFADGPESEPKDHAKLLYTLWAMGHYTELCDALERRGIVNEFWSLLENFSPRLNRHFVAPDLGTWEGFPKNLYAEYELLPGDVLVIKQDQRTLWEWQHAGMIRDERMVYSAMYTETVLEQPVEYYSRYATRLRVLRVCENHRNPALGQKACAAVEERKGNMYGVSDKWYALNHPTAPMYCSQVPWYAWMQAAGLNLDSCCPDYDEIADAKLRRFKLCAVPHAIVFPTNLAESCDDVSEREFVSKTECVLDIARPGYEEQVYAE